MKFSDQRESVIEQGVFHSERSIMTNAKDDDEVTSSHVAPDAPASDAQLMRAMQMGDSAAWQELYQRYLPSTWRFALQLVGDRQVAEDLVAESLLALCRKASELDPESTKLFGWLRGVVRHKAMDHHRAKARTGVAMSQRADIQDAIEHEKQQANRPSASMERSEQASVVMAVMDELDERKRQCLEWKYLDKVSVREMAVRLDLTEKAVESILYRARIEFRERFERREKNPISPTNHSPDDPVEPSSRNSI